VSSFAIVENRGASTFRPTFDGSQTTMPDHGSRTMPAGLMNKIIRHDLEM